MPTDVPYPNSHKYANMTEPQYCIELYSSIDLVPLFGIIMYAPTC